MCEFFSRMNNIIVINKEIQIKCKNNYHIWIVSSCINLVELYPIHSTKRIIHLKGKIDVCALTNSNPLQ